MQHWYNGKMWLEMWVGNWYSFLSQFKAMKKNEIDPYIEMFHSHLLENVMAWKYKFTNIYVRNIIL